MVGSVAAGAAASGTVTSSLTAATESASGRVSRLRSRAGSVARPRRRRGRRRVRRRRSGPVRSRWRAGTSGPPVALGADDVEAGFGMGELGGAVRRDRPARVHVGVDHKHPRRPESPPDPGRFTSSTVRIVVIHSDCPDGGCEATTRRCSVASGVWSGVSRECPAAVRLASERSDHPARSCRGVARKRNGIDTYQVCPPRRTQPRDREHNMFIIGIDPHKGSHTAVAVDRSEISRRHDPCRR